MKREKLKKSNDYKYDQYVFRIPSRRKNQFINIMGLLDELEEYFKVIKKEDEKLIRRADIIIESLEIGLNALKNKSIK